MRTLLLAPHHDDETLFASFLCLTYDPLVVVVYGKPDANGVPSSRRSAEFVQAVAQLNVSSVREWPLSDTKSTAEEVEAWMIGLRDPSGADDWDLVFAPAVESFEGHPQHDLVGSLADLVFGNDCTVEHYTTYRYPPVRRTRTERPVAHDPSWLFRKHAALACYSSAADTPSYRHFSEDLAEYLT